MFTKSKKISIIMLMLFIYINLLSVFICLSVLDFSLLVKYSHIFLCFCCFTVVSSCLYYTSFMYTYLTWNHFALIPNIYYIYYSWHVLYPFYFYCWFMESKSNIKYLSAEFYSQIRSPHSVDFGLYVSFGWFNLMGRVGQWDRLSLKIKGSR